MDALLAGKDLGEEKTDALLGVVREAAANSGHVSDATWAQATGRAGATSSSPRPSPTWA